MSKYLHNPLMLASMFLVVSIAVFIVTSENFSFDIFRSDAGLKTDPSGASKPTAYCDSYREAICEQLDNTRSSYRCSAPRKRRRFSNESDAQCQERIESRTQEMKDNKCHLCGYTY